MSPKRGVVFVLIVLLVFSMSLSIFGDNHELDPQPDPEPVEEVEAPPEIDEERADPVLQEGDNMWMWFRFGTKDGKRLGDISCDRPITGNNILNGCMAQNEYINESVGTEEEGAEIIVAAQCDEACGPNNNQCVVECMGGFTRIYGLSEDEITFVHDHGRPTLLYATWIYAEEDTVKSVGFFHDDDLSVYIYSGCGEESPRCTNIKHVFGKGHKGTSTVVFGESDDCDAGNCQFKKGWNLVYVFIDNEGQGNRRLWYVGEKLSDEEKFYMYSDPNVDWDFDGVREIFDQCPDTRHGDEVILIPDSPFRGCSENQVQGLDIDAERCLVDGGVFGRTVDATDKCCGDTPATDFGTLSDDNEHICLRNDGLTVNPGTIFEGCDEEWCWVSTDDHFNPITINKPGEPAYDIVSNSKKWLVCNETSLTDGSWEDIYDLRIVNDDFRKKANSLICYKEGNNYAWARCSYEDEDRSVKVRKPGDAIFTLPFNGGNGLDVQGAYNAYYQGNDGVDFTGFTHLNAIVRFVDESEPPEALRMPEAPFGIMLTIRGTDGGEYFNEDVMHYAASNPTYPLRDGDDGWVHLKIPIPEYTNVNNVRLSRHANSNNEIEVKTVYLSNANTLYCSGTPGEVDTEIAWISSLDQTGPVVHGRKACVESYGDNAWVGDQLGEFGLCCGDGGNENAPRPGDGFGDLEQGCWYGKVASQEEPFTRSEIEITRFEKEATFTANDWTVDWSVYVEHEEVVIKKLCSFQIENDCERFKTKDAPLTYSFPVNSPLFIDSVSSLIQLPDAPQDRSFDVDINVTYTNLDGVEEYIHETRFPEVPFPEAGFITNVEYTLNNNLLELQQVSLSLGKKKHKILSGQEMISAGDKGVYVGELLEPLGELIPPEESYTFTVSARSGATMYFEANEDTITLADLEHGPIPIYADSLTSPRANVQNAPNSQTTTKAYSCFEDECYFPLFQFPPYDLKNLHPDLFDLYHISKDVNGNTVETFVGENLVPGLPDGVIKIVNSPKNHLFVKEVAASFETCNVGSPAANPYCTPYNNFLCDPTTGEWDNTAITEHGYAEQLTVPGTPEEIDLASLPIDPEDPTFHNINRTHSAPVTPGRNILQNTAFTEFNLQEVVGWELRKNSGELISNAKQHLTGNTFTVPTGHKLKSVRIPVEASQIYNLKINETSTCDTQLQFYTDNGTLDPAANPVLGAAGADSAYLKVEFSKAADCTVFNPMLQLTQAPSPAVTTFYPGTSKTSLACCPQNYCWNGDICVQPGGEAYFVETVDEGRYFRCIAGQWDEREPLNNWAETEWGFCDGPDQCLVLSTGDTNATIADFPEIIPTCINHGDWMYDHLCAPDGEWTTRTKTIAKDLLKIAERRSRDEYSLYCTNYTNALPEPLPTHFSDIVFSGFIEEGKVITPKENTPTNHVCVLQYNEDDEPRTIFATTLNSPITVPDNPGKSFLNAFNLPGNNPETCEDNRVGYSKCDIAGFDVHEDAEIWYSEETQSIVYGREGVRFIRGGEASILRKIQDWLIDLFTGQTNVRDNQDQFIDEAQNLNELYLLKSGRKQVRALKETRAGNSTLVAEFVRFETPVCDYVDRFNYGQLGENNVNCTASRRLSRVEVLGDTDNFWNQLTGRLRVSSPE